MNSLNKRFCLIPFCQSSLAWACLHTLTLNALPRKCLDVFINRMPPYIHSTHANMCIVQHVQNFRFQCVGYEYPIYTIYTTIFDAEHQSFIMIRSRIDTHCTIPAIQNFTQSFIGECVLCHSGYADWNLVPKRMHIL